MTSRPLVNRAARAAAGVVLTLLLQGAATAAVLVDDAAQAGAGSSGSPTTTATGPVTIHYVPCPSEDAPVQAKTPHRVRPKLPVTKAVLVKPKPKLKPALKKLVSASTRPALVLPRALPVATRCRVLDRGGPLATTSLVLFSPEDTGNGSTIPVDLVTSLPSDTFSFGPDLSGPQAFGAPGPPASPAPAIPTASNNPGGGAPFVNPLNPPGSPGNGPSGNGPSGSGPPGGGPPGGGPPGGGAPGGGPPGGGPPTSPAVPEPDVWVMMLIGVAAIGGALRARRRQSVLGV